MNGDSSSGTPPAFTPSEGAGTYCFRAEYPGDNTHFPSSDASPDGCFTVGKFTATVKSTPSGTIAVGGSETDQVAVTGNATGGAPSGSAKFLVCAKGTSPCASGGTQVGATVVLTAGGGNESTATSSGFTPSGGPGTYCFRAEYEGGANYNAGSDASTGGCFTVGKAATTVKSTPSGTIAVGGSETDQVAVTGNATGGAPSGSAKFLVCAKGTSPCASGGAQVGATVVLTAGGGNESSAKSASLTPAEGPGTYCFRAEYEGGANYNAGSDASSGGCFTVGLASSVTTSTPSSGSLSLGASVSDGTVATGDPPAGSPTGAESFSICGPLTSAAGCPGGSGQAVGSGPVSLTPGASDTSAAQSADFTPTSPGTWCFAASYPGDSHYAGSSDASAGECVTVARANLEIGSTLASAGTTPEASNSDSVVVSGNAAGGTPTGKIAFFACGPLASAAGCPAGSGAPIGRGPVELVAGPGNTANASSPSFVPGGPGTYCFRAEYEGDANYAGAADAASAQCFSVASPPPAAPVVPAGSTPVVSATPSESSAPSLASRRTAGEFAIVSMSLVRHHRLRIVVETPRAGRVSVIATHTLGTLARASALEPGNLRFSYDLAEALVGAPGAVTLELRPSTTGVELLHRLRHPWLRVTVLFAAPGQAPERTVRSLQL